MADPSGGPPWPEPDWHDITGHLQTLQAKVREEQPPEVLWPDVQAEAMRRLVTTSRVLMLAAQCKYEVRGVQVVAELAEKRHREEVARLRADLRALKEEATTGG